MTERWCAGESGKGLGDDVVQGGRFGNWVADCLRSRDIRQSGVLTVVGDEFE